MKKTILHIIQDLGRGGAETMLVKVTRELTGYTNIVVTLFPKNNFGDEFKCDKYYCLNISSVLLLPFYAPRLKKIIRENNVDIVHSHLFWPTILARIATPKNIPLITTIHAFIATSLEYKKWHIRFLDRLTYKIHKNIIIAVAEGALKEYFTFLKVRRYKAYTLYTFADISIFRNEYLQKQSGNTFKLLTVGALRLQKNQGFLLEAFKVLQSENFQLDIYGEGPLRRSLEKTVVDNGLNVNLKGETKNIEKVMTNYDLFVMSSTYEGFALSVLEAMAMQMPLLLSDISSFREQCQDCAEYFHSNDVNDFILKLKKLSSDKKYTDDLGAKARKRVIQNFTLEKHIEGLQEIYSEALVAYSKN